MDGSFSIEFESAEDPEGAMDWLRGIGTGAATGAATGAVAGPWGALIGGIAGAGLGALQTHQQQQAQQRQQRPRPRPRPRPRTPAPRPSRPPRPARAPAPQRRPAAPRRNDAGAQLQALIPVLTRLVTTLAANREQAEHAAPAAEALLPATVWTGGAHVHSHVSPAASRSSSPNSPLHDVFTAVQRIGREGAESVIDADAIEDLDTLGIESVGTQAAFGEDHDHDPEAGAPVDDLWDEDGEQSE